jgi:hypothetical protein
MGSMYWSWLDFAARTITPPWGTHYHTSFFPAAPADYEVKYLRSRRGDDGDDLGVQQGGLQPEMSASEPRAHVPSAVHEGWDDV